MENKRQKPSLWRFLLGTSLGGIIFIIFTTIFFSGLLFFGIGRFMALIGVLHHVTDDDVIRLNSPSINEVYLPHATDYSFIQDVGSGRLKNVSITSMETGEVLQVSWGVENKELYYVWDELSGGYRKATFIVPEAGYYEIEILAYEGQGQVLLWPFIDQNSRRSAYFWPTVFLIIIAGIFYFFRSMSAPLDRKVAKEKADKWKELMDK